MMVGHTLLKVISDFAWAMMGSAGLFTIEHIIPLLTVVW